MDTKASAPVTPSATPEYVKPCELAVLFRVHINTIRRAISAGRVQTIQLNRRGLRLIPMSQFKDKLGPWLL